VEARARARLAGGLLVLLAALAPRAQVHADQPAFSDHDIETVLYIAKSDDKNRVDYGMRLDEQCAPAKPAAVFPYWREFEQSPPVRVHPLNMFEVVPYGIRQQGPLSRTESGVRYLVRLRNFKRDLTIITRKDGSGHCLAEVETAIAGRAGMRLASVFLQLGSLTSVEYVDISGRDPLTGEAVRERLRP